MLTKRKEDVRQTDRKICIIITDLEIPLLTTAGALHRRTVVPSRSSPTPAIRERGRIQEKLKVRPHSAGQGTAGRDVPTIVVVCRRRRPQVRVVENARYEGKIPMRRRGFLFSSDNSTSLSGAVKLVRSVDGGVRWLVWPENSKVWFNTCLVYSYV